MNLDKENLKKIRGLILFTIVVLIVLWKYSLVLDALGFVLGIVFPFLLGGAIAFILNVPMHFLEKTLFYNKKTAGKAWAQKLARPLSLVLTILFVLGVISLVIFVVVPKLGSTVYSLGASIQDFVPKVQHWVEELFDNNKEIVSLINDVKIDWDKILNGMMQFFKNGAGSVLGSTFTVAKSIVSGMATFVIAFVFACYILLQKERLNIQIRKVMYAYLKKGLVKRVLDVCSLTYKTFSQFSDRAVCGGCDTGNHVCDCDDDFPAALCAAGGGSDCIYRVDSDFWRFYRMHCGGVSDPYGCADEGGYLCDHVPCSPAD